MRRRFVEKVVYTVTRLAFKLGCRAVRIVPHRWLFAFSDSLANAGFALSRGFRLKSISNIGVAMADRMDRGMASDTARRSLRSFFRACVEITIALESSKEQLRSEMPIAGLEYLDAALAKGNGVIVLSAHLGNFFLVGTRLAIEGYPAHVLVSPPRDPQFAELMDDVRLQVWQRTIRARPRRAALNALNTVLRRNEIAIVVADEYRDEHGIPVRLFGGNVNARRGPATLALRTGAAIVPALLVRQPDDGLKLIIEPELELARAGKSKNDVRESMLRITQWLERTVRAYPDQWNWTNIQWQDGSDIESAAKGHRLQRLSH
jgi:Kdo2-lipid IVA lauroyltransferase/acyltransferase